MGGAVVASRSAGSVPRGARQARSGVGGMLLRTARVQAGHRGSPSRRTSSGKHGHGHPWGMSYVKRDPGLTRALLAGQVARPMRRVECGFEAGDGSGSRPAVAVLDHLDGADGDTREPRDGTGGQRCPRRIPRGTHRGPLRRRRTRADPASEKVRQHVTRLMQVMGDRGIPSSRTPPGTSSTQDEKAHTPLVPRGGYERCACACCPWGFVKTTGLPAAPA